MSSRKERFLGSISRGLTFGARISARITGFLEFDHRPEFQLAITHNVSETGSVPVFR
jgi:hypothetical protein